MSEELEVLKQVAARLEAAGIPYMLTGSLALNYYATPRMTRDIDLVVEVSAADADRITDLFSGEFYVDRRAVQEAIGARGIFNVIHSTKVIKVDLVVRKDSEYRRLEFSRRRRVSVEGQELSIVTPEDLVLSKLDWARDTRSEVQLADVRSVVAAVPGLDRAYVARWADRLGLADLYREAAP